jgi:hypothetical protein
MSKQQDWIRALTDIVDHRIVQLGGIDGDMVDMNIARQAWHEVLYEYQDAFAPLPEQFSDDTEQQQRVRDALDEMFSDMHELINEPIPTTQ